MNVTCIDRERIFLDGQPEEWAALAHHAVTCAECAEELRVWRNISTAAKDLQQDWDTPHLWQKIEHQLTAQYDQKPSRWNAWLHSLRIPSFHWQTAAAFAVLLVVSAAAVMIFRPRVDPNGPFLKNSAVAEVERTEAAYEKAIDKLAAEAHPQLNPPATPLMASYREKLLVLDNAIEELREQAGQNPANAHLRGQLLAMYHEKQETLREVLETKR